MKAGKTLALAQLSLAAGDIDGAIRLAQHILAHLPQHMGAHLFLAALFLGRGEREEARRHLEAVLAVDPINPAALSLSPWALEGRAEEGGCPNGGEGIRQALLLAEALWRGERWREAKRILAGLEERNPSCLRIKLLLADIFLREGSEVEGNRLLHEAQALDPSLTLARSLLGNFYPHLLDVQIPSPPGWESLPEALQLLAEGCSEPSPESPSREATPIMPAPEPSPGPPSEIQEWPDQLSTAAPKGGQPEEGPPLQEEEAPSLEPRCESEEIAAREEGQSSLKPIELIVTSKSRLQQKFGAEGYERVERRLAELEEAISQEMGVWRVCVDDEGSLAPYGLAPVDPTDPWAIKGLIDRLDEGLRKEGRRAKFILLIGGEEITPFCPLTNPTEDEEPQILSDAPYGCRGDNYLLPDSAVGRLPDGGQEEFLISLLEVAIQGHREAGKATSSGLVTGILRRLQKDTSSLGLSAEIWREASQAVFEVIGKRLEISPPFTDLEFLERHSQIPPLAYFNLHGVKEVSYWYGHQASSLQDPEGDEDSTFPIALTPLNINWVQISGSAVYTEACYGGYIVGRSAQDSIALSLLGEGTRGVIGSTGMAYGSLAPPLSGADLLGRNLWLGLKRGFTIGEALQRAKLGLVEEMAERQGFLDGEDQKTLLGFVLYGDPSLRAKITPPPHKGREEEGGILCPSVICGKKARQEVEVDEEVVAKVRRYLEERLPAVAGVDLRAARQEACVPDRDCNGECSLGKASLPGKGSPSPSFVFTSERFTPLEGDGVLKQVVKITTDQGGNVMKVAVSK